MKNRIKKAVSLLLAVIMVACALPMAASAEEEKFTEGYLTYTTNGSVADIVDCDENAVGALVIPSTLGGYPVAYISPEVFDNCDKLTSITIPASVCSVATPFYFCSSLEEIVVEDGNENYCSIDGVLFEIDQISDSYALNWYPSGKEDKTYAIPDNTSRILDKAFIFCKNLETVTFPKNIEQIGESVFAYSSIQAIDWPKSIPVVSSGSFVSCKQLKDVTIPEGVTGIGAGAFYECPSLNRIQLPSSLTNISEYAFFLSALETITVPDSITTIEEGAFSYCSQMRNISFGNGVERIGDNALLFSGLESVNIPATVKSIGRMAFAYTGKLKSVSLSEGVEDIGEGAFSISAYDSITIPSSVKSIGDGAFSYCWNLKEIKVNSDNESYCTIDGVLFDKDISTLISYPTDKGETFYKVPDSVTLVQANAANNLKAIMFPKNIKLYETITTDEGTSEATDVMFGGVMNAFCFEGTTLEEFSEYMENYIPFSDIIENFTVYGYSGTDAEKYANENEFIFVDLNEEHTHTFGEWTVTTEATCTAEGEEARTCTVCGKSETRTLEKKAHDLNHVEIKSTCKVAGVSYDICSECEETFNYTVLPLAPHTFGEWTVTTEATCTAEGEEARTCTVCGKSETRKVAVIAHDYKHVVKNATCQETGFEKDVCNRCGKEQNYVELPFAPHTFGEWTINKKATVFETGEKTRICSICGFNEKEVIEKIKSEESKDEKTGISVVYTEGNYDGDIEISVTETFDGMSFNILNNEKGNFKNSLFDITTTIDGKKVQPNGSVYVKIPLPNGYNPNKTVVYYITNDGKLEKMESRTENGYIIFETTHFSYYAIVDETEKEEPVNPPKPDTPSSSCTHICHKGGISKFFYKIALFFRKLFRTNKYCSCGVAHY